MSLRIAYRPESAPKRPRPKAETLGKPSPPEVEIYECRRCGGELVVIGRELVCIDCPAIVPVWVRS